MGVGLSAAKMKLQSDLEEAFEDGYKAMFPKGTDLSDAMASSFAKKIAEQWANALYTLATSVQITGSNNNTSTILGMNYIASVTGPVPGPPVPGIGTVSLTGTELNLT